MKKNLYEKPSMKVFELQHRTHLLAGSPPDAPGYDDWLGSRRSNSDGWDNENEIIYNEQARFKMEQLKEQPTDVAVLLVFFTRTETLRRTFEVIRKARPAHLLLYQDGLRNAEEAKKIQAARQIVADDAIDWPAEVKRSYHTENSGAWASNYDAQRWAFSLFEKCIVLEDDSTPSATFIPFCKELLDRYENDKRIAMIAGFNHEEKTQSPYDYLFTSMMPVWGWASWRRVVSQWDGDYSVVDDKFSMQQLERLVSSRQNGWKEMVKKMRKHRKKGKPIYETVLWSYMTLNSCLTIVPTPKIRSVFFDER